MSGPLMPKATAVWLLDNTALTFRQIADFCELHILEVETLANQEAGVIAVGLDPLMNGQLTKEEIELSTKDPNRPLVLTVIISEKAKKTGARYTPIARRQDRPNAITWIVKHYPDITDGQIMRLVGTTKNTIGAIRDRSHWNMQNIKPQSPVLLGICTQANLDTLQAQATKPKPKKKKAVTKKPASKKVEKVKSEAKDPAEKAATKKK
jgi:hypothetical protein